MDKALLLKILGGVLFLVFIIVVVIVVVAAIVSVTSKNNEKFGSIYRRRIISNASLKSTSTDETENDLEPEHVSLNQPGKENYVESRGNLLFKGQFDHLINKINLPVFNKSEKNIVEEIGDNVKEKVESIAEHVSDSNIAVDSTVPSELIQVENKVENDKPVENDYITEKVTDENTEPELNEKDNVITNSGNAIESSVPESFGLLRTNNNFEILNQSSKASEIAQNEDSSNEQMSPDMVMFIKNLIKK